MDAKIVGNIIASLRKKCNMTQQELSKKLNVTDKAISKWENGQGFPDITAFPKLSSLFGVSVDYLMFGKKKSIAICGSIITDIVKEIDSYPMPGMMTYVSSISYAVGGCAPNTAINLSKIDSAIPINIYGKVGNDDNARFIISELLKNQISVDSIKYSNDTPTSFCDVMSMPTGERTFFHKKGANAYFSPDDIDIDSLDDSILHIGYLLLLDIFDSPDTVYGTKMARFLHDVQKKGIKTSIDVVSDSDADYAKVIMPALKYTDYAIMNEIECTRIWNLNPYDNGSLNTDIIKSCMENMVKLGVKEKVIIHSKKCSFILDAKTMEFIKVNSLDIPDNLIKGSVGAGDAFCAGCLYALYNNYPNKEILEFATSAAACNLFSANSTSSMKSKNEILKLSEKYPRLGEENAC